MKRVFFVRHGESESNVTEVAQGLHDVLTPKGEEQALSIAKRAQGLGFDALISSDAVRTAQTAQAIAEATGKTIEFSPLFREAKRPSSIVGFAWTTPEYIDFTALEKEHWGEAGWHFEDEENYDDLVERARQAVMLLESHEKDTLMVVTHGRFLRYIVAVMAFGENITPQIARGFDGIFRMSNTGVTVCYTKEGKWQLFTWNDRAHFAE